MSDDSDDELGNGWVAIAIGVACLILAWYLYARVGADPQLIGKAAVANFGWGKKLLIGLSAIVGVFFLFRGIAKLRSGD